MESLENAYENNQSNLFISIIVNIINIDLSANINFQSSNKLKEDFYRVENIQKSSNTKAESGKEKNCVIY